MTNKSAGGDIERIESPASVPALIRYDNSVPGDAKILFAEICLRADAGKTCTVSSEQFAALFGASTRTINRWLGSLEDAGYIAVEKTRELRPRKITIRMKKSRKKAVKAAHKKPRKEHKETDRTSSSRQNCPEVKTKLETKLSRGTKARDKTVPSSRQNCPEVSSSRQNCPEVPKLETKLSRPQDKIVSRSPQKKASCPNSFNNNIYSLPPIPKGIGPPLSFSLDRQTDEHEKVAREIPSEIAKNMHDINPAIMEALLDFYAYRKQKGKPLTTIGVNRLIKKLCKLSGDVDEQIAMLNQSIENSWTGVYALPERKRKRTRSKKPADRNYGSQPDFLDLLEQMGGSND